MKYIPGNIFVNCIVGSLGEGASGFLSAPLLKALGPKNSLIAVFVMTLVASVLLGFVESNPEWTSEIPPIIIVAKFGISGAFNLLYSCTSHYFEDKFMGTVFGL